MGPRLSGSDDRSLCPDGIHHVYASVNAAPVLWDLTPELRRQVIRKLCDIAEIAFLSIGSDHWDESKLLRLSAGGATVLYSVDANGVLVHHVVLESQAA